MQPNLIEIEGLLVAADVDPMMGQPSLILKRPNDNSVIVLGLTDAECNAAAQAYMDGVALRLVKLEGHDPEPVSGIGPAEQLVNAQLLAALKEAREALQFANDSPGGPITDTIWMVHQPETLFDFLDSAISAAEAQQVDPKPVNARLLEVLRFYAEGHHFIRHDTDAWDTVSGEPQNFLEDEANTATVEDGSLAKAALSAIGEVPISFDLKTALDGVKNFFDDEYFHIDEIVDASQVCGQKQEEECQPEFDHCFVNQSGGGITGDDYHGTVFFHVGAGQYLTVGY